LAIGPTIRSSPPSRRPFGPMKKACPDHALAGLSHLSSDDAHRHRRLSENSSANQERRSRPFGPKEIPSTLVFVIVPGEVYAKMPAPK